MVVKKIFLVVAMLGVFVSLLAADDPFLGTWKVNLGKSKYNPGPLPKSSSSTYELTSEGGLKLIVNSVNAQGKSSSFERIETYDGKPHPVHGEPNGADAVSAKRIGPCTIEITSYRHGQITSRLTRRISKDGKTMTSTAKGTNAQGQPFEETRVFDKQ